MRERVLDEEAKCNMLKQDYIYQKNKVEKISGLSTMYETEYNKSFNDKSYYRDMYNPYSSG